MNNAEKETDYTSMQRPESTACDEAPYAGKSKHYKFLRVYLVIGLLVLAITVIATAAVVYAFKKNYRDAGFKFMDAE